VCRRDGPRTAGPAGARSSPARPGPGLSSGSCSADTSPPLSTGDSSENRRAGVSRPRGETGGAARGAGPLLQRRAASSRLPRHGGSQAAGPGASSTPRSPSTPPPARGHTRPGQPASGPLRHPLRPGCAGSCPAAAFPQAAAGSCHRPPRACAAPDERAGCGAAG